MIIRTVLTIAALTLHEAARRRVLRALGALTVLLLALSTWGLSMLGAKSELGELTSGETAAGASQILNLVMFGLSMIAAFGTAFLAGPTLAGEVESGMALAILARPVRRSAVLLGKWLGLATFGGGFVVLAGLAQVLIVRFTTGYRPPNPAAGLALLAAQTAVLLTLALLLSTVISPMASGIVAVGLFVTAWIAGVVGWVGNALGNPSLELVGTVSQILLPTDGLWHGAMHSFQNPAALAHLGGPVEGSPLLSNAPLTLTYLAWAAVWVALIFGLAGVAFQRRDL